MTRSSRTSFVDELAEAIADAEIAEQVAVLVARHVANEFGADLAQSGEGVLDVVDGEHDAVVYRARAGGSIAQPWQTDQPSRLRDSVE